MSIYDIEMIKTCYLIYKSKNSTRSQSANKLNTCLSLNKTLGIFIRCRRIKKFPVMVMDSFVITQSNHYQSGCEYK